MAPSETSPQRGVAWKIATQPGEFYLRGCGARAHDRLWRQSRRPERNSKTSTIVREREVFTGRLARGL
jgi:hypothetical protein